MSLSYGQSNITREDIVDPNSTVIEVFSGGEVVLLEGPAMSPERFLYFTDITITDVEGMKAGKIYPRDFILLLRVGLNVNFGLDVANQDNR